jgi:hypothetical protein
MRLTIIELEAKDRSLDGIKKGGEGAPLSKASGGLEELSGSSINQRGYPGRGDTSFDPIYERRGET